MIKMESNTVIIEDPSYVDLAESIIEDCDCYIVKKEWHSKYNTYIVYGDKPLCEDGFNIVLTVAEIKGAPHLEFLRFILETRNNILSLFRRCSKLTCDRRRIPKEERV